MLEELRELMTKDPDTQVISNCMSVLEQVSLALLSSHTALVLKERKQHAESGKIRSALMGCLITGGHYERHGLQSHGHSLAESPQGALPAALLKLA